MKTEKSLDEKIDEIERNIPGMKKLLESYILQNRIEYFDDSTSSGKVQDVEYLETAKYKIAVAKWRGCDYCRSTRQCIEHEWATVYYTPKEEKEIQKKMLGLHGASSRARPDQTILWRYGYISLSAISDYEIEGAWVNEMGDKGPKYKVKLE